jgi:transposase InsO family protein
VPKHIRDFAIRARLAWFVQRERFGSVSELCRYFGISRKTYYKWKGRLEEAGGEVEALADRSRRPKRSPRRTPEGLARRICAFRRRTGYGPYRVWLHLGLAKSGRLSVFGVYRVLVRSGLHQPKKGRRRKPPRAYTRPNPGDKVQIDAMYVRWGEGWVYQWTAIDVCTRLQVAQVTDEFHSTAARDFLAQVIGAYPFAIRVVQTDNDSVFTLASCGDPKRRPGAPARVGPFTALAQKAGIEHRLIPPGSPSHNGHVERVHRTDREEFYRVTQFRNLAELNHKLVLYLRWYNNERPHMGLGGRTPLQAFLDAQNKESVTHVS